MNQLEVEVKMKYLDHLTRIDARGGEGEKRKADSIKRVCDSIERDLGLTDAAQTDHKVMISINHPLTKIEAAEMRTALSSTVCKVVTPDPWYSKEDNVLIWNSLRERLYRMSKEPEASRTLTELRDMRRIELLIKDYEKQATE